MNNDKAKLTWKAKTVVAEKNFLQKTKCGRCKLEFKSYDEYIDHSCTESNLFQCDICKRSDIPFTSLESHIEGHIKKTVQIENNEHKCDTNKKSLGQVTSMLTHEDKENGCERCNKTFDSSKLLNNHQCVERYFKCKDCGKELRGKHLFKRHCMTHKNELYKCQYCYTAFIKKKSIERHVSKFNCSKIARNFWFSTYDASFCRICHLKFMNEHELLNHFNCNHNGNPHKCIWCDKELATKSEFQSHIHFHNIEKYTCFTCQKVYTSQEGYRKHKLKHRNAEHKCNQCGAEFLSRRRADIHIEKCKNKKTKALKTTKISRQVNWQSKIIVKKVRGGQTEQENLTAPVQPFKDDDDDSLSGRRGWFDDYISKAEEVNVSDDDGIDNLLQESEVSSAENSSDDSGDEISETFDFNYKSCRLCGTDFQLEYELLHHFVRYHSGEIPHKCPQCEELKPLFAQLKEHMKVHGIGLDAFHCGYCSKAFKSASRRLKHIKKCLGEVGGGPSTKECRRCHKTFHTKCGYKRHKIASCKNKKQSFRKPLVTNFSDTEVNDDLEPEMNSTNYENTYETEAVLKDRNSSELLQPSLKVSSEPCDVSNGIIDEEREELVNKVLKNEKVIIKEARASFPCRLCEESFSFERGLVFHFKKKHPGVKPLICPHCGIALADKLKEHLKTHGIGEEFVCELCQKKFNQKFMSKIHELWHQGIEYKCGNCKQKFLNEEKMQKHITSAKCNNRRSLMQLPCEICGRHYRSNFGLKNHYLTHTPRELRPVKRRMNCEFCGKWFETDNALLRHRRIHTGEKPFCCRFCPRTFAQEGNCKVHERTHTGESKPRRRKGAKPVETTLYIINAVNEGVQ